MSWLLRTNIVGSPILAQPCTQYKQVDERVWTSAFGAVVALLQDQEGTLDPVALQAMPPRALAALADAAARHRWYPD